MPTTAPGATSTYGLTNGIKLDVEDLIQLISPTDAPLQGAAMGATDAIGLPTDTVTEKLYQWLDETLLTPRSLVAATSTTGDAFITVTTGDGLNFQTGDVVMVGSEYIRITGYSVTTSDILLGTRAFSGSAHTLATGDVVVGVGSALPEGSVPPTARWVDRNTRTNVTEIFGPYAISTNNSDLAIQKYGITNEFDHQVANRIREAAIAQDQAFLYGAKVEDTTNHWRTFAGLWNFITSNIDSSTTTFSLSAINTENQTVYGTGGNPDVLMVGAKQKGVVSTFTSAGTIFVPRADGTAGRKISVVENDFGTLSVLLNRWMRLSDAVMFNRDQTAICTLRPLQYQALAITGDFLPGMVLSEKGFKVYRQAHAAKFSALT